MDDADVAAERQLQIEGMALASIQSKVMDKGVEGFCDLCSMENKRLMPASYFEKRRVFNHLTEQITEDGGICSQCRDRHRLP